MNNCFLKGSVGHVLLSSAQKKTFEMKEPEYLKTKYLGLRYG